MGTGNSTPEDSLFTTAWRKVDWRESYRDQVMKNLRDLQSNHIVDHLRILLVGPAGAGKSAFITSVNSAFQGRNTHLAHSLNNGLSATHQYTVYKLNKDAEGSFLPFVFGDTMGLEQGSDGVHTNDIINILQGHVQEGYTFNSPETLTAGSEYFNKTPNLNDKVHCLVFVLPAAHTTYMPEATMNKMKQILEKAQELKIPLAVIVTKVDDASSLVKDDLTMIYKSRNIKQKMEVCRNRLGIPVNCIFPVKNYHEEISTNTETDILILMAVTNIVNFARDFAKASEKPWRTVNWSDREPMIQTLREFQSNRTVDHLRILFVGPAGAGKSAFITSVNTTLQGRNTNLAHSLTGGLSVTSKYTVYKLNKGAEGSFFPFVFGDTMGLEDGLSGVHTNDIISILQGHVQEGYTFNPSQELTAESNYFNQTPSLNDKVHCVVFVLPADHIIQISDEIMHKMKQILQRAHGLGIPPAVIITKVDAACPLVKQNLKMIYRSKTITDMMNECDTRLGVPKNYIFSVKNYHEEIDNSNETDILILTAVRNIVNFANDFVKSNV